MKKLYVITFATTTILLSACASNQKPCEEILEVKRQEQQCAQLRKTMENKDYPQQALTAKIRYEEACLNLRYYRDDYDTICKGDQKPIGAPKDSEKAKEEKLKN